MGRCPDRQRQPHPLWDKKPDIPDHIRKLAELKDRGILTEDEFAAKKAELLAKL